MADGECVLPEGGDLRVFVPGAGLVVTFTGGGDAGSLEAKRAASFDDGELYTLHVPKQSARVRLVATTRGGDGVSSAGEATLVLRSEAEPSWVAEAKKKAEGGDTEGARAVYASHASSTDDVEAGTALHHAARLELARGNVDEATRVFRAAIARERSARRVSDAADDTMALAFALAERSRRFAQSHAALESASDLLARYPDGRARELYFRAILDGETGHRREALALYAEAERRGVRLGIDRFVRTVRTARASDLDLLGRFDDALAERRAVEAELGEAAAPCDRVIERQGMGFTLLEIATRGGKVPGKVAEATAILERARGEVACTDSYLQAVTLGNLAFAALLAGEVDRAAAFLGSARGRVKETPLSEGFFWLDLDGRIALARRAPARALAVYAELEERAHAALSAEHEWGALVGRGAALEALGRPEDALAAYAEAEQALDRAEREVPVGGGRGHFLVERERSATRATALLLARGKREEAFRWARRARRRVLAGLEGARRMECGGGADGQAWTEAVDRYARERAAIDAEAALDWKLSVAELAGVRGRREAREKGARAELERVLGQCAPSSASPGPGDFAPVPPGELALLFEPARDGWIGMTVTGETPPRVTTFPVPSFDPKASPEELARLLLEPARVAIDHATRLHLLLPGAFSPIDMHALPFEGAPLLAKVPVEYDADLAAPGAPLAEAFHAVVVGDPQRSLPHARVEARSAAADLVDAGSGPVDLLEGDRATHDAVLRSLATASFFHYAGHARYAGEDGWESVLPLAHGGHLLVSDILALRAAPSRVLVSGCDAAHTARDAPGESLGIAQAFLVAGSDVVIAPTRAVPDELSARFVERVYAALAGDRQRDLPSAARRAALDVRAGDPASDWANFRVLRRR
ncbi:MAG TPA: CHAT domain-containing protein [Polyangiaceae bacterium]|jgi:tetratricopeptide (TPR) repeat protein